MAAPPGTEQPEFALFSAPDAERSFSVNVAPSPPRSDGDNDDELLEIVVFRCREVTVYRIPPRSAQGHK